MGAFSKRYANAAFALDTTASAMGLRLEQRHVSKLVWQMAPCADGFVSAPDGLCAAI